MYDESNIWESIEQKAQWFEQSQTIHHDLETVHQEFYAFYGQFIIDSSFQISRIKFPLLGAIGNCESTLIFDENSWEHLSDDIMKSPDYDRYTYDMVSTDELFFLRFHLKEVGTISEMGFEKINGEWCLTLYWISPC